jgi:hypothetical protein
MSHVTAFSNGLELGTMTDVMLLKKTNDLELWTMTWDQENTHQIYRMADR